MVNAAKTLCILLLLCSVILPGQVYAVDFPESPAQKKAFAFIENVLPINTAQWNIELKVDADAASASEYLEKYDVSVDEDDDVLIYFLGSMVGTADSFTAIFLQRDGAFFEGIFDITNAPSYNTFGRQLEASNVSSFLTSYAVWSGFDSTRMAETLSTLDLTHNATTSLGNITATVSNFDSSTAICWVFEDFRVFEVSFQKSFPVNFYDGRTLPLTVPTPTPTSDVGSENVPLWGLAVAAVTVAVALLVLAALLRSKRTATH